MQLAGWAYPPRVHRILGWFVHFAEQLINSWVESSHKQESPPAWTQEAYRGVSSTTRRGSHPPVGVPLLPRSNRGGTQGVVPPSQVWWGGYLRLGTPPGQVWQGTPPVRVHPPPLGYPLARSDGQGTRGGVPPCQDLDLAGVPPTPTPPPPPLPGLNLAGVHPPPGVDRQTDGQTRVKT